ncbi:MAG: aminotransferase class V-fold PLP-dependent enzyme [Ruminococcus sp.]|nr:aminotransferase class V-fold PLP-dependent enzyme [Ruminococcus sp.]
MNTPIHDFLTQYSNAETLRLHMPGHKGRYYPHDITEVKGADSLFEADGIIAESEKNTSRLYGTKATYYSTAGSTLSIQAMLFIAKKDNRKMYALRNVHRSFLNACVLLNISVRWIYPNYENTIISGSISTDAIEKVLSIDSSPKALYITSPDYYGMVADIESIAEVCHRYNTILLVDNAHGTLLNFLDINIHPIHLGADMCSDSAHKMLPVLTGGGYLHINNEKYVPLGKVAMSFFGSTSPSYLIMESLDLCNRYISENLQQDISRVINSIERVKHHFKDRFCFADSKEPLHLTFLTWKRHQNGLQLADNLRKFNIECEYADAQSVVLLFSPLDDDITFKKLFNALDSITLSTYFQDMETVKLPRLESKISMQDAVFTESETISIDDALGRVCAEIKIPCPPAVPIAVSGEVISKECIKIFKNYGIKSINVVK